MSFYERGHQTGVYVLPQGQPVPPAYAHSPVVSEYFAHCEEQRRAQVRRMGAGDRQPRRGLSRISALHPRQPRTIAVWHPRGAHQTECWRWYFVDKAAPQQVKDFLRDYYIRYSGPAGMTEQDDMENWNYAHAASRGAIARRYPYSYEQGQGYEIDELRMAGIAHSRHGDGHHRGQVERAQSAQSVPPLGRIHGSRQLGRARDLAAGRPGIVRAAE